MYNFFCELVYSLDGSFKCCCNDLSLSDYQCPAC
jgi:hypothetical protein